MPRECETTSAELIELGDVTVQTKGPAILGTPDDFVGAVETALVD